MNGLTKKNILKLKQSSTLVINEKCKKLIAEGKKVYQFGFGQSPFPVPESIVTTLKNNAHRKEYLPIQGLSIYVPGCTRCIFILNRAKLTGLLLSF